MLIQFNTDKTIKGGEKDQNSCNAKILKELSNYQSHITRIDVHLSDQNGKKAGSDDILCLLEATLEAGQPLVVSDQANTVEIAMSGAIDKLKGSLETRLGRMQEHHK